MTTNRDRLVLAHLGAARRRLDDIRTAPPGSNPVPLVDHADAALTEAMGLMGETFAFASSKSGIVRIAVPRVMPGLEQPRVDDRLPPLDGLTPIRTDPPRKHWRGWVIVLPILGALALAGAAALAARSGGLRFQQSSTPSVESSPGNNR